MIRRLSAIQADLQNLSKQIAENEVTVTVNQTGDAVEKLDKISRTVSASDVTIKLQGMVDDFYNNPMLRRGLPEISQVIIKYLNPADKNEFIQYVKGKGVNLGG